ASGAGREADPAPQRRRRTPMKKTKKKTKRSGSTAEKEGHSASHLIDARIKELVGAGDWRGETLARVRALIRQADPDVVEEVKWRKPSNPGGVPVWSHPSE